MEDITIERNIPIPGLKKGPPLTAQSKAMLSMGIGESFLIERGLVPCVRAAAVRYGLKICTRTVDGGVRIWRVG